VAGFIGPEVFKTREQLVRCCLEDIRQIVKMDEMRESRIVILRQEGYKEDKK
jgi:hypothetical protein